MRSILWAAAAALIVVGGSAPAFAQMGGGKAYDRNPSYGYAKPAPPTKRYSYRSGVNRYSTCGEFRYWSDGRCWDARTNPPKLR